MRINYKRLAYDTQQIQSLLELAQLAESCDSRIQHTFMLANRLRDSPQMKRCVERLMANDDSRRLIKTRQLYQTPDPEWLASLEPGSLGNLYLKIIEAEALSLDYGPPATYFHDLETDADYVNYRIYCTHDLHHIVSGFALDIFGEVGARTLLVAQCGYPPMALTGVINLLTSWLSNDICIDADMDMDGELSEVYLLEVMALSVRMAKTCKPLFGLEWHKFMPMQLSDVRQRLAIQPITEGAYSWHSQHASLLT